MGMYTQLHLGIRLQPNVPDNILDVLKVMLGESFREIELPEHELFKHDRWRYMLQCDSYYFQYKTTHLLRYDDIGNHYWFNVTCNLKNYEDEIDLFVDWIKLYTDASEGDFLGYSRYEETEDPTVIKM